MADRDRAFLGHPLGLANLFFTEMWERFSYYGMRAFLIFYLGAPKENGGQGMFDAAKRLAGTLEPNAAAGAIVGMFGASVYLLGLPGGWIADRFLGQRRAVIVGGIGIAVGNGILAIPGIGDFFYVGLIVIAIGTGFLKPNISSLVGQLYKEGDPRRDGGYTIYYMGINIGAFFAPLAAGYLAMSDGYKAWMVAHDLNPALCWNFAFGLTAVGMVLGLIQFVLGKHWLGEAGKHPTVPTDPREASRDVKVLQGIVVGIVLAGIVVIGKPSGNMIKETMGIGLLIGSFVLFWALYRGARDAKERRGILAMIPLYIGAIAFFAIFEQAPTTLNIFADSLTKPDLFGIDFPTTWYQSVNSVFIVLLAPVFAWLWVWLNRRGKEPTSVNKFAIGMAFIAVAFVVMLPAGSTAHPAVAAAPGVAAQPAVLVSGMHLIGLYFFYTVAELCISPVGLSSMSKLAPKRLGGMVMGIWFLGTAIGIYLAGRATSISSGRGFNFLFVFLIAAALIVAAALFVVAPKIKKMMAEDTKSDPLPDPLPEARVVKDES